MNEKIAELARLRARRDTDQGLYALKKAAFQAETADLLTAIADLDGKITELEAEIKGEALTRFAVTGNKTPADGVSVRVYKVPTFDEPAATEWARYNMPHLVKTVETFDAKAYGKALAAEVLPPEAPGELHDDPRAFIDRDLSALVTLDAAENGNA